MVRLKTGLFLNMIYGLVLAVILFFFSMSPVSYRSTQSDFNNPHSVNDYPRLCLNNDQENPMILSTQNPFVVPFAPIALSSPSSEGDTILDSPQVDSLMLVIVITVVGLTSVIGYYIVSHRKDPR